MDDEYDILGLLVKWSRRNHRTGVNVNVDTLEELLTRAKAYDALVSSQSLAREWACERLECDH